jgi:hypothetical protein
MTEQKPQSQPAEKPAAKPAAKPQPVDPAVPNAGDEGENIIPHVENE